MKRQPRKVKVHSITGRINLELMYKAWKAVRRNRGAAGIDKISIQMFEENLEQNLEKLMRELKTRSYKPIPLRRVHIPKGKGKTRPLGIPSVRCRVAQEVVRRLINPIFERIFHNNSMGFRPGRSCHTALDKVMEYYSQGYKVVVDADIKGFFDNISHKLIMTEVSNEIADGNILSLIENFLKSGVMEEGRLRPTQKGTPQGGVISPLLANIALNQFDQALSIAGYKFVRYADDFVIMCKNMTEAEKALDFVRQFIEEELELELHPEKTKITSKGEPFDFLGFRISRGGVKIKDKSREKFKTKIRMLTTRCHGLNQQVVEKLNQTIRGTVNYFTTRHSTMITQFRYLDSWIRKRIRCMKYKRISKRDNWRLRNKHIRRLGILSCLELSRKVKTV